jgi:hypothetical protein
MKKYTLYIPNFQEHSSVIKSLLDECEKKGKAVKLNEAMSKLNMTVKKTRAILQRLIDTDQLITEKVGRNYQYFKSEDHKSKVLSAVEVKVVEKQKVERSERSERSETSEKPEKPRPVSRSSKTFTIQPTLKVKELSFEPNAKVVYPEGFKYEYRSLVDPRYEVEGPVRGEFYDDWLRKRRNS